MPETATPLRVFPLPTLRPRKAPPRTPSEPRLWKTARHRRATDRLVSAMARLYASPRHAFSSVPTAGCKAMAVAASSIVAAALSPRAAAAVFPTCAGRAEGPMQALRGASRELVSRWDTHADTQATDAAACSHAARARHLSTAAALGSIGAVATTASVETDPAASPRRAPHRATTAVLRATAAAVCCNAGRAPVTTSAAVADCPGGVATAVAPACVFSSRRALPAR